MNTARKKAEEIVYKVMDALDKTGKNSAYYKEKFAAMSDEQFVKFNIEQRVYRLQIEPFEIEPKMEDIKEAANLLEVPLVERINLAYTYKNSKGEPVQSQPCYTIYAHVKRMKQLLTKKIHIGTDASKRDMKTGRLIGESKGGQMTDREFESLAVLGMDTITKEFARPRADSMHAKSVMNNIISSTGQVSINDVPINKEDSLANNLLNVYLIGCHLKSNLITDDDYFLSTLKDKNSGIKRLS